MPGRRVTVNRAPVLALWAVVVAERLGFDCEEALTLGKAVVGLKAHSKSIKFAIYELPPPPIRGRRRRAHDDECLQVNILNRAVPVALTPEGLRVLAKDQPVDPKNVKLCLASKFGSSLGAARRAMVHLAEALPPRDLAAEACALYEWFQPESPAAERSGGARSLDLDAIVQLAEDSRVRSLSSL